MTIDREVMMPIPYNDDTGIVSEGYRLKAWQPAKGSSPRVMVVQAWREGDEDGEPLAERTVPMMYPNQWGIDVADMEALERATDELLLDLAGSRPS